MSDEASSILLKRTKFVVAALVALLLIVPPIGLTALSWVGAVALGLLGVAAALEARARAGSQRGATFPSSRSRA